MEKYIEIKMIGNKRIVYTPWGNYDASIYYLIDMYSGEIVKKFQGRRNILNYIWKIFENPYIIEIQ